MSILAAQMANINRPCTEPLTECGIHRASAQSMERVLQRTVGLERRMSEYIADGSHPTA